MNKIELVNLKLKTFTDQNILDYCLLNNINHLNIIELNLSNNKLTDISGVKLFKNLENLYLSNNEIKDISVLKDLKNLKILHFFNNETTDISFIKNFINLEELSISNLNLKNENKILNILKNLKNLKILICYRIFNKFNIKKELKNVNVFSF